jgi:tubulin-specific chaperone A
MAPRTQLEITTSSVIRLVKEEASYHNELQQQAERIKKLEADTTDGDENREYTLKQEVCALYRSVASTESFLIFLKPLMLT